MRAQLEVHAGDPDQPERATLELTRALLAGFPRQRAVTLAIVGFAPHPGLTPSPWALEGVLEACVEAERTPLTLLTLADPDTGEALLRKVGRARIGGVDARDLVERTSRDRSVSLRSHGQARPFVVPREVLGSSLILVAPLLLRAHEHSRVRHWQGPLALALEQLARAWGHAPPVAKLTTSLRAAQDDDGREAAATALELIAASFASAAVILDATWAGALDRAPKTSHTLPTATVSEPPRLLGELDSPDRCVALAKLERLDLDAVLGVDQWFARALGLTRSTTDLPIPNIGTASPGRWPQLDVTVPRNPPTRLADRAISGIRSQSKRITNGLASVGQAPARELPALPARVGGRFAQQWTARWYGDHERMGR